MKKEVKTMELRKKKYQLIMAFVLMLTMTTAFMAAFPVGAQAPDLTDGSTTVPTFLKLNVSPNPVGITQTLYINTFMTKPPLTGGMGTTGVMYQGITVEITKPNGDTQTLAMPATDATGGTYGSIMPDQLGDWTFQAHYPAQHIEYQASSFFGPSIFYNYTYAASDTEIITVTVQTNPAEWNYHSPPLPEEYWTRPIYATNWEWGEKLGGSWFGLDAPAFAVTGRYDATGNFNPYTLAPNSGHIMWSKAIHNGGQPGGPIHSDQSSNFKTTTIINNFFDPVIVNGILYYGVTEGPSNTVVAWNAVDMRTGDLVWTRETTESLRMGQTLRYKSVQEYGSWSFLIGQVGGGFMSSANEWTIYDAFTGLYLANIENVSSAEFLMDTRIGHEGSLLGWSVSGGMLRLWNSTKLYGGGPDTLVLSVSGTYNWPDAYEWEKPVPTELDGNALSLSFAGVTREGVVLLRQTPTPGMFISLNLGWEVVAGMDAMTGELLWGPVNHTLPLMHDISIVAMGEGTYVLHDKDTDEAYGYSLEDGSLMWGPVELPGNAWSTITRSGDIAYGQVYIWDYGGFCSALDLETGDIVWTWTRGYAGLDTPYNIYELWYNDGIADGKIILSEGKMYDPPLHPSKTVCINTTDGSTVWTLTGWTGRNCPAIADGLVILWNSQDGKLYSIGKGPTTTTVTGAPKVSQLGSTVLLEGNVLDISAGSQEDGVVERFPNGIPCAADEYMDDWMSYVYMQQNCPTDFMGVTVRITAYDPNGNFKDYGVTVTDMNGNFGFPFVPEIEGTYWITAIFEGTESYWRSEASTYITVDPAPEAFPNVPTAEEIAADAAQRTIAMLPKYPDVPTADQIAADTASRTIAMLPQYPDTACPTIPAYQTIDLVVIVLVVIAIIIGIYGLIKKK
jgi:hypothetical protein